MIFDVDCDGISVRVGVFGLIFKNALSDLILDHASNKGVLYSKVRILSFLVRGGGLRSVS